MGNLTNELKIRRFEKKKIRNSFMLKTNNSKNYTKNEIIKILNIIFVEFGGILFRQTISIPPGT
jgi:hypothetical protein